MFIKQSVEHFTLTKFKGKSHLTVRRHRDNSLSRRCPNVPNYVYCHMTYTILNLFHKKQNNKKYGQQIISCFFK